MPLPIISVAQMRDWEERTWAAGTAEQDVMLRAGEAVARQVGFLTQPDAQVLFLAGPGNNGGDTKIAADQSQDRKAIVLEINDPTEQLSALQDELDRNPALIVDGLFGIGLNRDLDEGWITIIDRINNSNIPVLSVDIPSGLNADTGQPSGAAIEAHTTLTLGTPKTGLIPHTSAPYTGRVLVANRIGLHAERPASEALWIQFSDMFGAYPKRDPESHKGDFGHVGIIAGSTGFHGAAVLCARAALRARPGLVSVYTTAHETVASQLQSAMVHPWTKEALQGIGKCSAFVIGPGLAGPDVPEGMISAVRMMWGKLDEPIIADASALDWLVDVPAKSGAFRAITPHAGEAARLLDTTATVINQSRESSLRKLSQTLGAYVVLKGRHTLIGSESGPVLVNSTGNPGLAQGGSGDVLAGFLGGLMAQPALRENDIRTLAYGVWKHGLAADRLESQGDYWGMDDLIHGLGLAEFD